MPDGAATNRMMPPTTPMTKRTLITVSHAIEQAAVTAVDAADGPVVLLALFQRPLYFDRERIAYRELSRHTELCIVGVIDAEPDVPPRIEGVAISPGEPLAGEWSVVMVSARAGAVLVALDSEEVRQGESSLERGRLFGGWWSFARADALTQLGRLRDMMGDRLSERAHGVIDGVLEPGRANGAAAGPQPAEQRTQAALSLLVRQLERANRRIRALEEPAGARAAELDELTGLANRAFLKRWVGSDTEASTGNPELALILFDINGLHDINEWSGRAAGDELLRQVAATVQGPLRDIDRAVRLGDDDFLLVLPHLSEEQATRIAFRLCADIAMLHVEKVAGGANAAAAVTTTRRRPIPLDELADAIRDGKMNYRSVTVLAPEHAPQQQEPPEDRPRAPVSPPAAGPPPDHRDGVRPTPAVALPDRGQRAGSVPSWPGERSTFDSVFNVFRSR